ncbi:asparagine synthase (glutamine-hydrolyzing) [Aliarcobacter cryaerophilus]|uniref:asparagine synthase (glutamine-hydrolyzing) n=1 Tax=Aliarcobacter cryaerophilus TaxID=28198 RepID=UPI0021B56E73|nr:asparagine synthase (glutamine-hydrolyzing) [Aliarcobacter cryaerophilus]MCT7405748.1 asparagine synthase (glutamine-hydrolyzing) [Aliarcobacter cryaerophilus]MCT7503309.1 asparagine synthase (glutamine-hydrolyzing) [Aliarcobacter cryaerophilus]
MCGISGIINKNGNRVDKDEIQKINDLISHRGPDDEGFYFEKNFAFGHRRLSILDLSSDGHQPMHYLEKYTITYNGEVYNYLEIREELIKDGYKFISNTDTEVILASYDKWGEECVNKFNGMWAFAIYDKEKEIIFCSRDRFGVKPFYYTEIDNKFVFGSEIKQLLEFYEERFVNKKILMDFLIIGYENHINETFFENIFKLQESHNLIYNLKNNSFKIKRYYDIKQTEINLDENSSVDLYKSKFMNSIELRLRSDVKVGTCLSGGLDSSSIAAIASSMYKKDSNEKFIAIHAKSSEHDSDESFFAKEVANSSNLDLKLIEPTKDEFINSIDDVIYTQEEPFGGPSIFMQYFVMKKAKEIGCTVLLDGQGGDETLVGYERYYPSYLMSLCFFDLIKGFFNSSKNSKLSKKQLFAYFVYFTKAKIRIKRLQVKNSFIKAKYFNLASFDILEKNSKNYLNLFELQHQEIFYTQMPHLLRYEDRNSMRHSIETRLPFIDYTVVETALSIPNKYKIKDGWTKYILRRTIDKILPNNIVWRKNKFGFEAPTKSWVNSIEDEIIISISKSKILSEISDSINLNRLDLNQKWKLFNISKWEDIYKVSWREE